MMTVLPNGKCWKGIDRATSTAVLKTADSKGNPRNILINTRFEEKCQST